MEAPSPFPFLATASVATCFWVNRCDKYALVCSQLFVTSARGFPA